MDPAPAKRARPAGYDARVSSLAFPTLSKICSLAVDSDGTVFVGTESALYTISSVGRLALLAGSEHEKGFRDGQGSQARFNIPRDLAVEADGSLLVADTYNHCLRRVSPHGTVTTLAGGAREAGFADGVGTAARFYRPRGIAVDRYGIIYVTDHVNHCVRRVSPEIAMWDALVPISAATSDCRLPLKNRDETGKAVTDGAEPLPLECFVAMNRFPVKAESAAEFEARWAERESKLQGQKGCVGFMLLRRDRPAAGGKGAKKGGGYSLPDDKFNYSTCTIWASKEDWSTWRTGDGQTVHAASQQRVDAGELKPVSELLSGSASPIFWEGTLALQSDAGM